MCDTTLCVNDMNGKISVTLNTAIFVRHKVAVLRLNRKIVFWPRIEPDISGTIMTIDCIGLLLPLLVKL
jgi:hypothetical protein